MSLLDKEHYENNPLSLLEELSKRVDALERMIFSHYKGTSASDFTTAELSNLGDYGYQTTDDEIQINCAGTIRAVSTAAL